MVSINYIGFDHYSARYCMLVSFGDKASSLKFESYMKMYFHGMCGQYRDKTSTLWIEPDNSAAYTIKVTFLLTGGDGNEASKLEHNEAAKGITDRYIEPALKHCLSNFINDNKESRYPS